MAPPPSRPATLLPRPPARMVGARYHVRFVEGAAELPIADWSRVREVAGTVFNALSGVFGDAPQMHPFGNRVGRRFMGFLSYSL